MAGTQTERAHERQERPGETPAEYLERYGQMRLIRRFEQEIHRLFLKGEVHGTTHLSAGQEAVPVGICSALEPDDWAAGTYRGHGHALAKGTDPEALAAEMLGRATGVCGWRATRSTWPAPGCSTSASTRTTSRRRTPRSTPGWIALSRTRSPPPIRIPGRRPAPSSRDERARVPQGDPRRA